MADDVPSDEASNIALEKKKEEWYTECPQNNVHAKPGDFSQILIGSSQEVISLYFLKIGHADQEIWSFSCDRVKSRFKTFLLWR